MFPVVLEYKVPLAFAVIGELRVKVETFKDPPDNKTEVAVLLEPRVSVPLLTVSAASVPDPEMFAELETVTGPEMFDELLKVPPFNVQEVADFVLLTVKVPNARFTSPEIEPVPDIVPSPLTDTAPVKVKFDCAKVPPDSLTHATVTAWVKDHTPEPLIITLSALLNVDWFGALGLHVVLFRV